MSAGVAQLARASAFQAEGYGFESHCPLHLNKNRVEGWKWTYILLSANFYFFL